MRLFKGFSVTLFCFILPIGLGYVACAVWLIAHSKVMEFTK